MLFVGLFVILFYRQLMAFDGGCHYLRQVNCFECPKYAEVNDEIAHIHCEIIEVLVQEYPIGRVQASMGCNCYHCYNIKFYHLKPIVELPPFI